MKTCTKCLQEKDLSLFGKHKGTKDGLNWWCKACNIANAQRFYKPTTAKRDTRRLYFLSTAKERSEKKKASKKAYLLKNKDRYTANRKRRSAVRYQENPRWQADLRAEYRKRHLEDVRKRQLEYTRKDRAKHPEKWRCRWAVSSAITQKKLVKASTLPCVDCGGPASRYDHYLGYAVEHRLSVQPVCTICDGARERKRGLRVKCEA